MKRVLMFSYEFPPEGGIRVQRVTRFVRHLRDFGWEPVVVTSKWRTYSSRDDALLSALPPDLEVVRFPGLEHPGVTHQQRLLKQSREQWAAFRTSRRLADRVRQRCEAFDRRHLCFPDEMNCWAALVRLTAPYLVRKYRPDVLWGTGDPWSNLVLAGRIHQATGIPAVGDIRDPWSWHPHGYWNTEKHRQLEQKTVTSLTHLVTVTDGFKRKYARLYPEMADRISVIRNGFEHEDIQAPKKALAPLHFVYVGSVSAGNPKDIRRRTLYLFLKALRLCRDRGVQGAAHVRVTAAGPGTLGMQGLVDEYGLRDSVQLLGARPQEEGSRFRREADVLLLVDMQYDSREASFIALKVYEYLAANRPILALLPEPSEAAEIIMKTRRGVVCRVDDVEDIVAGIRKLLECRFAYDEKSDVSEYSTLNTTRQLADLFDRVSSAGNPSERMRP